MPEIRFTELEAEIMDSRLSAPDCIAEALTDVFPGEPNPPYTKSEAMQAAERIWRELQTTKTVSISSRVERDIIEDAIDGSTFPYFISDAVEDDDITAAKAASYRRAMSAIEKKARAVGLGASFPRG